MQSISSRTAELLLSVHSGRTPTRMEAITTNCPFQGLMVRTKYGLLPWWSTVITSFEDEVESICQQILDGGFSHEIVNVDWDYGEPGQPYGSGQLVPPRNLLGDLNTYCSIVDRVAGAGLIPIYALDGEGSPDWIRNNLVSLVSALGPERIKYGPFEILYDGVWPAAWSVQTFKETIPWIRSIIGPDAYLGCMFAVGPNGNPYFFVEDESDYGKDWMQCLDYVIMSTGPDQIVCPALINGMQYLDGPQIHNTSECIRQFMGPWLMAPGTPRGPYVGGFREWKTYGWVRGWNSSQEISTDRNRAKAIGITSLG